MQFQKEQHLPNQIPRPIPPVLTGTWQTGCEPAACWVNTQHEMEEHHKCTWLTLTELIYWRFADAASTAKQVLSFHLNLIVEYQQDTMTHIHLLVLTETSGFWFFSALLMQASLESSITWKMCLKDTFSNNIDFSWSTFPLTNCKTPALHVINEAHTLFHNKITLHHCDINATFSSSFTNVVLSAGTLTIRNCLWTFLLQVNISFDC